MSKIKEEVMKPLKEAGTAVKEAFVPSEKSSGASSAFNYGADWQGANLQRSCRYGVSNPLRHPGKLGNRNLQESIGFHVLDHV